MTHRLGWSYAYVLPRPAFAPLVSVQSDTVDNPNQSEVRLFEDGVALGPPHSLQRSAVNGLGAYAHWGGAVVFSASDNSNPRTNRRAYEARGWIRPDLLNVALALLLIGAATNRLLAHMGRQIETSLRRL
jgi:hypothetical protein